MKEFITEKKFLITTLALLITFISVIFISINYNQKAKINAMENSIVERSKSHYNHLKELQIWHTDNSGVYLKEKSVQPNKKLTNNLYTINQEKLIRISHNKMTKKYSRYAKSFDSFYYKLTSLKPLDAKNKPDVFEKKGLNYFEKNINRMFYYTNPSDAIEKGTFDLIGQLKIQKQCLACHQTQGYKLGDIKGGIRITIDTTKEKSLIEEINKDFFQLKLFTLFIGVLILAVSYWVIRYIFRQKQALQELNENLEELVSKRTNQLNDLNKNLELKIEEAIATNKEQEELMIAQSRHAAMGEMISMIAHQWRQPIAAISMGANNIILDIELDDINTNSLNEISNDILDQTKYLTKTIDDFSNFFKPTKEKNFIYPQDIIEESLSIIGKSLENNNISIVRNFENTIKIKTYSRELLQVVINILKNSKEAFENSTIMNKQVIIQLKENSEHISISIIDNAGGIPEDIIDKIFDPYFSTKKEKNGTGLGLYMAKTIINKHLYGELYATNINGGTEITIELPKG